MSRAPSRSRSRLPANVTVLQPSLFSPSGGSAGTLQARFEAFHAEHPDVYAEFKRAAYRLLRAGVRHYGAKAIFEFLRYQRAISGRDVGEPWKLNNNYHSRYARLLIDEDPRFAEILEVRALKTA